MISKEKIKARAAIRASRDSATYSLGQNIDPRNEDCKDPIEVLAEFKSAGGTFEFEQLPVYHPDIGKVGDADFTVARMKGSNIIGIAQGGYHGTAEHFDAVCDFNNRVSIEKITSSRGHDASDDMLDALCGAEQKAVRVRMDLPESTPDDVRSQIYADYFQHTEAFFTIDPSTGDVSRVDPKSVIFKGGEYFFNDIDCVGDPIRIDAHSSPSLNENYNSRYGEDLCFDLFNRYGPPEDFILNALQQLEQMNDDIKHRRGFDEALESIKKINGILRTGSEEYRKRIEED